jgi:hypothetical protein
LQHQVVGSEALPAAPLLQHLVIALDLANLILDFAVNVETLVDDCIPGGDCGDWRRLCLPVMVMLPYVQVVSVSGWGPDSLLRVLTSSNEYYWLNVRPQATSKTPAGVRE